MKVEGTFFFWEVYSMLHVHVNATQSADNKGSFTVLRQSIKEDGESNENLVSQ